jgi:hypothetical protein
MITTQNVQALNWRKMADIMLLLLHTFVKKLEMTGSLAKLLVVKTMKLANLKAKSSVMMLAKKKRRLT